MPPSSHINPSIHRAILILIMILSVSIRLINIENYQLNMDELQFLGMAQGGSLQEVWRRALIEVHPPLASFIRHFLLMASQDILAERIVSISAVMLAILGIYQLGKAAHNKNTGLFCAAAMAFSPIVVVSSFTLRNYAFFMLFLIWACVFYFRWQRKGQRKDLLAYCLLITLASASHFTGFFVAAALGLSAGAGLLFSRQIKGLAVLSLLHIPLAVLAGVLAYHYMLPGKTVELWRDYGHLTGGLTLVEPGIENSLFIPLISYFSPYLHTLHTLQEENVLSDFWLHWCALAVMLGGVIAILAYLWSLKKTLHYSKKALLPTLAIWVIALLASWQGLYPLSTALRHSLYLLPFFLLPFGILFSPIMERMLKNTPSAVILAACMVGFAFLARIDVPYDVELCLTTRDFNESTAFLDAHSKTGDVIVTGPVGAYFHLIYALDQGKTPYDHYADIPYRNHTTLLAPFAYAPRKPFTSWREFKAYLAKRLAEGVVPAEGNVWFVNMGWKGQEIWSLMECNPAQPLMEHYFSREGAILFSIKASALQDFLSNNEAWEECYKDYHPIVVAKKIHPPAELEFLNAPAEKPASAPANPETTH